MAANSDASIRRLKGPTRPIFPLAERMEVLAALADVDYVTWFEEDTPQKIIAALLPDVLVKGGDWGAGEIVGTAEVEGAGGRVHRVSATSGAFQHEHHRKDPENLFPPLNGVGFKIRPHSVRACSSSS